MLLGKSKIYPSGVLVPSSPYNCFRSGYAGCFILCFSRGGLSSAGKRHDIEQVLKKISERASFLLPLMLVSFV